MNLSSHKPCKVIRDSDDIIFYLCLQFSWELLWDIISPKLCYHGNINSSNTRRLSITNQDFIVDYNKLRYFLPTTFLPYVK
jgi:hypothetical protein